MILGNIWLQDLKIYDNLWIFNLKHENLWISSV